MVTKAPLAAAAAAVSSFAAEISLTGTITLGAIIVSVAVAVGTVIAMLFGIRYRESLKVAEKEAEIYERKAERLEADLADCVNEYEAYKERKHAEANEMAARLGTLETELNAERAKHDISKAIALLNARTPLFEQILERQNETQAAIAAGVAETAHAATREVLDAIERLGDRLPP